MDHYYRSEQQRKIYKLQRTGEGAQLYWVTVYRLEDGSFFHGRGMDVLDSWEKAEQACALVAIPATEEDYLSALRDYFAIDKNVREQFIEKYKL